MNDQYQKLSQTDQPPILGQEMQPSQQIMQPTQQSDMEMQQMQPGQDPGMQLQLGQQPNMVMQPGMMIQQKDFMEQAYLQSGWDYWCNVLGLGFAALFILVIQAAFCSAGGMEPVLIMSCLGGLFQAAAIYNTFFVVRKITLKINRSADSVEIKYQYKGAKSGKEVRKMSDMWDVHTTEVWSSGTSGDEDTRSRPPKHIGNDVYLEWKDNTRTRLYVPMPDRSDLTNVEEIEQFVFGGAVKSFEGEHGDGQGCMKCGPKVSVFFYLAPSLIALNIGIFAGLLLL